MNFNTKSHWEDIYKNKMPNEVSWTEQRPQTSIDFFESFKLSKQSSIIDIGGGESRFVDYLLSKGYENITVLDISKNAIDKAKEMTENLNPKEIDRFVNLLSNIDKIRFR